MTWSAMPGADPVQDILHSERQSLDAIFAPRSVAVIGATEKTGGVGRTLLWNLISNPFGGTVYPVNPTRPSVLGIRAYKNVKEIPERVDLAVIATPARAVPGVIRECVEAGVRGAIIISAGFKEIGPRGADLEQQILREARRGTMRLLGPNCLGLMRPLSGLNATFAGAMARPGNVGFISQSGALLTAILDWSMKENVGFSSFVSVGSMLDVGWGDLIYYMGDDPHTRSIILYMESVGDAHSFLSAAREVALTKPIIVIKAGRTEEAAKAAASHTGSLTGSDEILDAAFRRSGVLRVDTISDLFYMAEVLSKQPRPRGKKLTILTNAGGLGVLATDALISGGGELAEIPDGTLQELDDILPRHWSHANPVDILGDASPERYEAVLKVLSKNPPGDGLLVVLSPQAMTDPTGTAEKLRPYAASGTRPVLASWMGGAEVAAGEMILNQSGVPTFAYPDTATRMFNYMWQYSHNLRALYETPMPDDDSVDGALESAKELIEGVRRSGRTVLTEIESKQLLTVYGIPTVQTRVASSEDAAVESARAMGYPLVLKLFSETVTHKTDVGGVKLNLSSEEAVRKAYREIESSVREKVGPEHFQGVAVQPMISLEGYELIIGSNTDSQFGSVLLFGTGGQLVEVYRDRALGLPPLNTTLARRMMERTHIYKALKGVRGRSSVDLAALEQLMVRFSRLVVEQSWIKEIDINPLLASPEQLIALDARIILHDPAISAEELPSTVIRPYPVKYARTWTLRDGSPVIIRPIRPEDEPLMVKFHETLSEQTVYMRYLHAIKLSARTAHERLTRICFIDYGREMALVAKHTDSSGEVEIIGVGRLSKIHGTNSAEVAFLISDRFQNLGLGTELLRRLLEVARDENISRVTAVTVPENHRMAHIFEDLGFKLNLVPDEKLVLAVLDV